MKKIILLFIVAIFAISCGDTAADGNLPEQQAQQEQVSSDNQPQENSSNEDTTTKQNENDSNFGVPMMVYLLLFLSLILSVISLIIALRSRGNSNIDNEAVENSKKDIANLRSRMGNVEYQLNNLRSKNPSSTQANSRSDSNKRSEPVREEPHNQTDNNDNKGLSHNEDTDNTKNIKNDNPNHKQGNDKPAKGWAKTIYLDINSEDCFFNTSDQKTEASRFIANVITGGIAAKFELIDVDRIRSMNTSKSVRQVGPVPIKDANGIKKQKPGTIRKVTDENGTYWIIEEPVEVEFSK